MQCHRAGCLDIRALKPLCLHQRSVEKLGLRCSSLRTWQGHAGLANHFLLCQLSQCLIVSSQEERCLPEMGQFSWSVFCSLWYFVHTWVYTPSSVWIHLCLPTHWKIIRAHGLDFIFISPTLREAKEENPSVASRPGTMLSGNTHEHVPTTPHRTGIAVSTRRKGRAQQAASRTCYQPTVHVMHRIGACVLEGHLQPGHGRWKGWLNGKGFAVALWDFLLWTYGMWAPCLNTQLCGLHLTLLSPFRPLNGRLEDSLPKTSGGQRLCRTSNDRKGHYVEIFFLLQLSFPTWASLPKNIERASWMGPGNPIWTSWRYVWPESVLTVSACVDHWDHMTIITQTFQYSLHMHWHAPWVPGTGHTRSYPLHCQAVWSSILGST